MFEIQWACVVQAKPRVISVGSKRVIQFVHGDGRQWKLESEFPEVLHRRDGRLDGGGAPAPSILSMLPSECHALHWILCEICKTWETNTLSSLWKFVLVIAKSAL